MALQTSGTISINDCNIELGSSGTTTRGLGDIIMRELSGVSSGEIGLEDFYGAQDAPDLDWPASPDISVTSLKVDPNDAEAAISFLENGDITTPSIGDPGSWLDPIQTGYGAGYTMYYTIVSGSLSSSSMGSGVGNAVTLSTTRTFSVSRTSVGTKECSINMYIYPTGEIGPHQPRTINLTATVDGGF